MVTLAQQYIQQGMQRGKEEATLELVLKLRNKGYTAKQIADLTDIDLDKVESLLKK